MKKIVFLLVVLFLQNEAMSQVYNQKDSTYYTDSSFTKLFDGEIISYNTSNGVIQEKRTYSFGKLHGDHIVYHPNGNVAKKVTYVNGIPNGELLKYHPNGKLQGKTNYLNGDLHGEWIQYHENGTILGKGSYLHGKIHGETIWYDPTTGQPSNFYAIPLNW